MNLLENIEICKLYKITNIINNKPYIGQTWRTLGERLYGHQKHKGCPKLHNAIKYYGIENFKIEHIASALTQEDANILEKILIKQHDSIKNGYNIHCGGSNGKLSEKTKNKLSTVNKGKNVGPKNGMYGKTGDKNPMFGKVGHMKGKTGDKHPKFGKYLSQESKQKISEAQKGEKHHMYGKHHTETTKNKISTKLKGTTLPEETKLKIAESLRGENAPCAKLTQIQANQIREEYKNNNISTIKLAQKYQVSKKSILNIIHNKTYKSQ